MYEYQKTGRYFAQVADEIKDIAERELQSLGASEIKSIYRGIFFNSNQETLFRIIYQSLLLNRVLAPLLSFHCPSDRYLYGTASRFNWEDFLDPSKTFAIFASVSNSSIRHSKFASLRLKDAVVDYFKARFGDRPSVNASDPDVWFNLHIENDKATISLDTSGGPLHRRGYRKNSVLAPMIETLAAAIIQYSEWDGIEAPIHDPFCGSGTLLCEAYLYASDKPAGALRRRFGFERLPDFDSSLWAKVKKTADGKTKPLPKGMITGSDISKDAVFASRKNISLIDPGKTIDINQRNVFDIPGIEEGIIICNPPYGIRSEKDTDLRAFYKKFGDFLKQRCKGSTAYVYFGEREFIKHIGLKPTWKKRLINGGLDGRLVKYQMY